MAISTELSSIPNPITASVGGSASSYSNGYYFPVPFHLQQSDPMASYAPTQIYTSPSLPNMYSMPQYTQASQLFQRDAQIITAEAIENVKAALASSEVENKADTKKRAIPRKAAGQTWEDPTLADWPQNDFRLFCGDLGNEVNDDVLSKAFSKYPSFNKARFARCET